MRRGKRRYLYKMTAVIMLALFLPVVCFFCFFWNQSFEEMRKNNEEYYEKRIDSFGDSFLDKVMELKEHAASMVAGSKNQKSAFWSGNERFKENDYWYYEAQLELKNKYYDDKMPVFGIYYYEMNRIITAEGTLTPENLAHCKLKTDNTAKILEFFDKTQFQAGEMIFATANSEENYEGEMLIGYCTTMGKNQDSVLIYYVIGPDTYKDSIASVYSDSNIHYYIVNAQEKKVYLALGEAAQETDIFDIKTERRIGGTRHKVIHQDDAKYIPLSFVMYLTEESLQNDIIQFYHNMKTLLVATSVILLIICFAVLYVAYKPIYSLTSDLEYYDGGEFEGIRNELSNNRFKIFEQEMLIMDLILKHLIYGMPISEDRIKRLGISSSLQYYCVFAMEGHMLLSNEVTLITEEIESKYAVRLFVTDWQEKQMNIFVAFLKDSDVEMVKRGMNLWFEKFLVDEYHLYAGNVVSNLNEVQSSLMSCLEKKQMQEKNRTAVDKKSLREEVKTIDFKGDKLRKMKEDILAYLEIHYRDTDLSQTSVADIFQISNYTLSRMFKNQVGVGFTEYVNAKRLEYAKELLLTSSYSVREISIMAGFENDNYFSRIFKATTGTTPTNFRER